MFKVIIYITFIHLADAFIQSYLQKRTIEAIKPTKEKQYINVFYNKYKEWIVEAIWNRES